MENKSYLITGASSEVGRAVIKALNQEALAYKRQESIVAHYAHNKDVLEQLRKECSALQILPIQADLSKEEDVGALIQYVRTTIGVPNAILHFPASKLQYQKIKQWDSEYLAREMQLQVVSLGEIAKEFLPAMAKRKSGRVIVMLTSAVLGMPPKFMSPYVTVKHALLGLMRSLAVEYADKGVTVNGIAPNMMETQFLQNVDERIVEINRENCLMKRNVEVEEVTTAVRFLLSDGASYINGVNLNLSGGDWS